MMNITSFGYSCVGSSGTNGDIFYISEDRKLFILADGASGAGSEGKVLFGETCINMIKEHDYRSSGLGPIEYLDGLMWKLNNRLIQLSHEKRNLIFGTIDAVIIDNEQLTITTMGDSPAYYFDGSTTARLAKNLRRYEGMIEAGYITREQYEGYISGMHPMMWSCFDNFMPSILPNNTIKQIQLKPGDILVLCCDGIGDWIAADEIIQGVQGKDLEEGVQGLILQAKERAIAAEGYFDDLTVLAIKCS